MPFDEEQFKDALGQFATGVVAITGAENGNLIGFAAQSFSSLSLVPPLVLFCPQKSSTTWPRIRNIGQFCVNVLSVGQAEVSEEFALPGSVPKISWTAAPGNGAPVLEGVLAYLECSIQAEYDAGDHTIVAATVHDLKVLRADDSPLLYFRGQYGAIQLFEDGVFKSS